jgi:hypothetical protein
MIDKNVSIWGIDKKWPELVNQILNTLKLKKHPNKIFIGRASFISV